MMKGVFRTIELTRTKLPRPVEAHAMNRTQRNFRSFAFANLAMLATMRHAFDCQKLSFRPRRGNADPSYQRRPRLGAGCQIGHPVMHDKHADKPAPKPPRSPRCV